MAWWWLKRRKAPTRWSRTSQAFYDVLGRFARRGEPILEFGSSTGHISFRLAVDGHDVSLLDVRSEPIERARGCFEAAGLRGRFHVEDFAGHRGSYGLLWNSGLIQCLPEADRPALLRQAAALAPRLLLFYPDTDQPGKVRGADATKIPGVGDAVEFSVAGLPEQFCEVFDRVHSGRLPGAELGLPFDMLWLHGAPVTP